MAMQNNHYWILNKNGIQNYLEMLRIPYIRKGNGYSILTVETTFRFLMTLI